MSHWPSCDAPDLISQIKCEMLTLISSMTISAGYNYDWNESSVNPQDGDINKAGDPDAEWKDIFPIVFVDEGTLVATAPTPDTNRMGSIYQWNLPFEILVLMYMPDNEFDTLNTLTNLHFEDLFRVFTCNPTISGVCFSSFVTSLERNVQSDVIDAPGFIFTLTVRYRQEMCNVRTQA